MVAKFTDLITKSVMKETFTVNKAKISKIIRILERWLDLLCENIEMNGEKVFIQSKKQQ